LERSELRIENAELRIEKHENHARRDFLSSQFFILNSLLLLIGHFLPWAAHATSALTQSGHELAFSTNFTPGAGVFANEWFFVPAWCSALLLALTARSTSPLPTGEGSGVGSYAQIDAVLPRILFGGLALLIASLGFPPYPQVLTAFRSPDDRVQFFITLLVMAGVLALLLVPAKRMPAQAPAFIALACGVLALISVIGFLAVKPAIETLYGAPVGLGLGWWLTLATSASTIAVAGMRVTRQRG
jgi:hypothetical protein